MMKAREHQVNDINLNPTKKKKIQVRTLYDNINLTYSLLTLNALI